MRASLLTIGDELLIGQVLNSNAQWIGSQLTDLGLSVTQHLSVGDRADMITRALDYLRAESDVILIGGGLGPTHDDITMEVLSQYFQIPLAYDQEWIDFVAAYFKSRNRVMSENNKKQAYLLQGATRIDNDCGTAAGQYFKAEGVEVFVFPGVPHEMKSMMTRFVLPTLQKQQQRTGETILKRTLLTTGVGESALALRADPFVQKVRSDSRLSLAFLPSSTAVRLRLQMRANSPAEEQEFGALVDELRGYCGEDFFGFDPTTIEELLFARLKELGATLSLAESCTGGLVTHRLTQIPGASAVVRGAIIPYQTDVKVSDLGVPPALIESNGVVSEAVAIAMAEGVRKRWGTTFGVSTTGYLGPNGGDQHTPAGTICVAVATPGGSRAITLHVEAHRERGKERASQAALDLLRRELR
jgi:nicotinamide-nucleotide amidase